MKVLTVDQVRDLLRLECEKAGGQKAWAARHGLSNAYVSDVINGRREAGDGIARELNLQRFTAYQKKGVDGETAIR